MLDTHRQCMTLADTGNKFPVTCISSPFVYLGSHETLKSKEKFKRGRNKILQYAKITKILFQKRLRGWRLEVLSSVSILPAEISGYVAELRINFKSASLVSSVGNSGHLRPIREERTSRVPKGTKTQVFNVYFSNDLRQRVYSSVKIPLLWEGIFT